MTTNRGEMSVEENVSTALAFLERSGQEFDAGENLQASEKMWGAVSHAVMAIAKKKGWRYGKYNAWSAAVARLAEEYDEPLLASDFSVARKLHANFYRDFMEDDELAWDRPIVDRFVRRLVEIASEES